MIALENLITFSLPFFYFPLCRSGSGQASVTAAAIRCWSVFVCLVLGDANFRLPDNDDPDQEPLIPIRDAKWLEEASKQASKDSTYLVFSGKSKNQIRA